MISNDLTIGTIGAGNMATALLEGLLATGVAPARLWASDTDHGKLQSLAARGLHTTTDNIQLIAACDVVILAVKPQVMAAVVQPLASTLAQRPVLLISVAAGVPCAKLMAWTNPTQAIVRCMPNTPALVQAGASALFATDTVSATQRAMAESILNAV